MSSRSNSIQVKKARTNRDMGPPPSRQVLRLIRANQVAEGVGCFLVEMMLRVEEKEANILHCCDLENADWKVQVSCSRLLAHSLEKGKTVIIIGRVTDKLEIHAEAGHVVQTPAGHNFYRQRHYSAVKKDTKEKQPETKAEDAPVRRVYRAIQQLEQLDTWKEMGVPRDEIKKMLDISMFDLQNAVKILLENAEIYETIDDEHYKVTTL